MRLAMIALAAATLHGQSASALERASADIRAVVPLVCTADLSQDQLSAGATRVGQLREFCNSSQGYLVLASASGDVSGAVLIVDGVPHQLEPGREFEIARESSARRLNRQLEFQPARPDQTGQVSVRVVKR
jgi:hypothetical protein